MDCLVKRNTENQIVAVTTLDGQPSQLFAAIHNNIFLADAETSVSILNNAYTKQIKNLFKNNKLFTYRTGEPKLFYRSSKNTEFENLEDMLITDNIGETEIGFKNPNTSEFITIAKFDTESSERSRFLTDAVQRGVLAAERVLGEDGVTRFKGKGEFRETSIITARMAEFDALVDLGIRSRVNTLTGTIEFDFGTNLISAQKQDGEEFIRIEDVPQKVEDTDYENKIELLTRYYYSTRPVENTQPVHNKKSLDGLEKSLYTFLGSLGFSVTTLENYRKNYNTRFGQDPDIQAIADIVNKIVAFKEGTISIEDLSEEISHLAIEAYSDQNSLVDALTAVVFTPEYTEFNQIYRSKYSEFYSGTELEDQVRREILGKTLAKEIISRFDESNKNSEQRGLSQKLRQIWQQFVDFLQQNIKPYHRRTLDKFNSRLADAVLNNQIDQFNQDINTDNFYYSLMSKDSQRIEASLQIARKVLEDLYKKNLNQPIPNQGELDRIYEQMTETGIISSVNTIVGITTSQVSVLEVNLRDAEKNRQALSSKDSNRYAQLNGNLLPVLQKIKSQLKEVEPTEANRQQIESLSRSIDDIVLRLSNISPLIERDNNIRVETMVEEYIDQHGDLTPEQREEAKSTLEGNMRDQTWFAQRFGLVSHSANIVIQALARKVSDMGAAVTARFKSAADQVINEVYDRGLQKYQKEIVKKKDGKNTFYFINPIDFAKYDADLQQAENEIIAQLTEKDIEEIQRLRKNFSPQEIIGNDEKILEFRKLRDDWRNNEGEERMYTKEYYDARDARFLKAGVAEVTKEYLKNSGSAEFNIYKDIINQDGTIDRTKLTDAQRIEIDNIKKRKAAARSAYDQFGNLKEGLQRKKLAELSAQEIASLPVQPQSDYIGEVTVLQSGYNIENLSEDARIAYDLSNLNLLHIQEQESGDKTRNPIQAFVDEIERLEKEGIPAYDWMISNATITFTPEYYENLQSNVNYDTEIQKWLESIENPAERKNKQALLNQYKELQRVRRDLLRQNRKNNKPIETDFKNMDLKVRRKIVELDEDIADIRKELAAPQEIMSNVGVSVSSRGLSEDFVKEKDELGISTFDLALKHMTRRNAVNVNAFAVYVQDVLKGLRVIPKDRYENFIKDKIQDGTINSSMTREEQINVLKDEFASQYVVSYFQRYEPTGYQDVIDAMQSGELKASDVVKNREALISTYPALRYLQITPDYTWSEDINNTKFINPAYVKGGYYRKPRLDKYVDDEFFSEFGISKEEFLKNPTTDLNELTPTQNVEKFEFLKMMVGLREQSIRNYNDTESVNKYQLVQMSAQTFEKFARGSAFSTIPQVKESIKDFFQNRKDEKMYGEMVDDYNLVNQSSDLNIKIIPKYFQAKLDDPSVLTSNILEAGLIDLKQSILYSERNKNESDINTLVWKVEHQKFTNNGGYEKRNRILKRKGVSNYAQKADEYRNYHLYGVQQSRPFEVEILGKPVDLSRIVMNLQGWSRFSNLAFNVFIDLTSATTGIINNKLDRVTGDFYHKTSARKADSQLVKMMGSYIAEYGNVKNTTKLNQLVEFFNIKDLDFRIKSSSFSRGLRLIQKSPYLMSELCNLPVTPNVLLAILNDTRYSDGAFRDWNEFYRYQKNQNKEITKREIEALWNEVKNDSLYENVDITEAGVNINDNFRAKFGEESSEKFDRLREKVIAKARQVVQSADGVLNETDQVAAQRDMLTSMFMQHRGWLPINLTRRFKKRHFNISTGQFEEGHYRTLFSFLKQAALNLKNPQNVREYWNDLDLNQQRNIRRAGIETSILVALQIIGLAVLAGDDDDDSYVEDLARLIYLRTASEYNSSQWMGIPGTVIETAKAPLTALSTYENLEPISLLSTLGQEDSEGNSKFMKKLIKATPLKRIDQWSDIQGQVDAFRHYNDPTLLWLGEGKKEEN